MVLFFKVVPVADASENKKRPHLQVSFYTKFDMQIVFIERD